MATFPVTHIILFSLAIAFVIYAVRNAGSITAAFLPDRERFGNEAFRRMVSDLLSLPATSIPTIHPDLDMKLVSLEYERIHADLSQDLTELWIANKEFQLGLSYSTAFNTIFNDALERLAIEPGSTDPVRDRIAQSVRSMVSLYDWSKSPVLS